MIERQIVIALITKTEFLKEIEEEWNPDYMQSQVAFYLSTWCWEYFNKYRKAPGQNIGNIYIKKLRKGLDKDLSEDIEEILNSLSEEYEEAEFNLDFFLEEVRNYFDERQLEIHKENIESLLSKGKVEEAKDAVSTFKIKGKGEKKGLDLSSPEVLEKLDIAFDTTYQSVITFPGALGDFWNDELVRGGLVCLLAPEKRGKTFWLLEFMMRAYRQGRKVVFFQAGDMTEGQQLIRIATYLARRSPKEKFTGIRYIPIQDCIHNQKDTCRKKVRECNFGLFGEEVETREKIKREDLVDACDNNPAYRACFNCVEWSLNKWGTPWLEKKDVGSPLTVDEAKEKITRFFIETGRSIKLYTYENGTLTIPIIEKVLDDLDVKEDFRPDLVLVDYGDLVVPEIKGDFRHQEDHKWRRFRGLSQRTNALWIIPSQADTDSYKKNLLDMSNFSETKTKNAHVTAMYGLNQDKEGREKDIGIMRINRVALREGDFHSTQQVNVLSHLAIGRPFLGSYY